MPTYDYDCTECGYTFEYFQRITALPLETCPRCGGKVLRRIHGGAGLIFKGSGFYLTDYKRTSVSPSNGRDGADASPKDSSVKEKASEKSEK
ncbi:MAG: zinc ribbon domain-containing protein [candidate division KSB1 bacterium]|nr:zinc ribbon domain-containing protein [candidate division KSB1 bacterium]MDZ7304101.1 zinc ribbon domain-containing protein [candidate division KSB1 bacterium]MDZ7312081.1 zinc ribbon domain-containing protein [candidate division KSB1 bacterium]